MEPTAARERIQVIDVLRGCALFGIIAANMRWFNSPAEVYMNPHLVQLASADQLTQLLLDFFVNSKFIALFAMLFGLGFGAQMERGGEQNAAIYIRRLSVLAIIGAMHALLLWWGDILLIYALMGFLLLKFRKSDQDAIIMWALIIYWFPILLILGFAVISASGASLQATGQEAVAETLQRTVQIYREGSYRAMLGVRFREVLLFNSNAPFMYPRILSMFLFGLYIWRRGIFQNLSANLPLLKKILKWSLITGMAGNAGYVLINEIWRPSPATNALLFAVMWIIESIGTPAMSIFYACALILLFQKEAWRHRLLPFAAVGRTALTNYLMQTVICTALFYSYGLGLFGKIGPLAGLIPTVVIYAVQTGISMAWLRAFRFGPMEWVWRSLTYARLQPMRN